MTVSLDNYQNNIASSPDKVYELMKFVFSKRDNIDRDRENAWVISLNNSNKILDVDLVSMGTQSITLIDPKEMPLNKSSFLWNFEIVRLKNLERRFALGLIYHLSDGVQIEDQWLFRNHVFEQSVGNPRVVCELIERYRKEVVVTSDVVREVRHSGGLKEFDCSWFVIVFLGILVV